MATVKIQGEVVAAAKVPGLLDSKLHGVQDKQIVRVDASRADAADVEIPGVTADDLVEMHLDDGSVVVTAYGELQAILREAPRSRGGTGDPDRIPVVLDLGEAERGARRAALRFLRIFNASPDQTLADLATPEAIAWIEGRLAAEPGLYRLAEDGRLRDRITRPLTAAEADGPLLILLHGTASSTMGSFAGLFGKHLESGRKSEEKVTFQESTEWKEIRRHYGGRVYALEHRTLSASPAENALDLAKLLPEGAEVHLVTHSRGGLVGELLCRGAFGRGELKVFERGDRARTAPAEHATLVALGAELGRKRLRVERFVRVACPAAGTVLASKRLDVFLSVLLTVFQRALPPLAQPVAELLKATLLEVARRRADPEQIPGLEAQRPESPYAHFLNREQSKVDQDLCVIAGDLRRGNVLQSLRAVAGYGYFWQKNDLVVHTRAMYAGLPRAQGWVSYHESAAVTHFSYFAEAASRARVRSALLRAKQADRPEGFEDLAEALAKQSFSVLRKVPDAARGGEEPSGTVLYLPDLFETRLAAGETEFWPSAAAISQGGLIHLRIDAEVTVGELIDASGLTALASALGSEHRAVAVPYDWRRGSVAVADALSDALAACPADAPPVAVVAHGLGALGALELLRRVPDGGEDPLASHRVVLVAPPLRGSEKMRLACMGEDRLARILQCLGGVATISDIAGLLMTLPGVLELLPDECLDPGWWKTAKLDGPAGGSLGEIEARRARYRALAAERSNVSFLLGASAGTPAVQSTDPLRIDDEKDGDGWMRNPEGLPAARVWFAPALHEHLVRDPVGSLVAADLAREGRSDRGFRQMPENGPRRHPPALVFPTQSDLLRELLAQDGDLEVGPDFTLHVQVAHGSLDRLQGRPVLVGHYDGDGIWGAEAFLDRCLDGRLRRRHRLGNYVGPVGTGVYVPAESCHPEGALVVGLGDIGDLTAGRLSLGVERAVIEWALHLIEGRTDGDPEEREPRKLRIASLLVGTRGGSLTVRQSMVAVLRGVLRARRLLARDRLDRFVTIDDVEFVELWSDVAVAATHALQYVEDDSGLGLESGERVVPVLPLKVLKGARGNSRVANDWIWWRRIIIREGKGTLEGSLQYVTLGERSRAEERMVFTQRPMVDQLIERASKEPAALDDGRLVNALFELLLPVPLKGTVFEGHDLVLIVDRGSGRFPWELLARRSADGIEPLVSRVRVVRQFQTATFREEVAQSRSDHALVIGEPDLGDMDTSGFVRLKGAREEAEAVIEELTLQRYSVEASVGERSQEVVPKLFLRDYRVLHVAAHGVFEHETSAKSERARTGAEENEKTKVTGVVLGRNRDGSLAILSADVFRQLPAVPELVFLNCCHLGALDGQDDDSEGLSNDGDRTRLAASVAEALMEIGVRALVVAGWAINDSAAKRFAREFYRRMLRGEPFGDAVHEARCVVWKEFGHTTTWGAYQCYGDPAFRLRPLPGGSRAEMTFVAERELVDTVSDVAADANSIGVSMDRVLVLQERLRMIEDALSTQPEWRSGEVLFELAEAWKSVGDLARAVERYREALTAEDARSPVKAAEQLCNLLDRLAYEESDIPPGDPELGIELDAAESADLKRDGNRVRAEAWLDWVERLGPSAERANIRGGILKRAAARAETPEERRELLEEAAAAYEKAIEHRREIARKAGHKDLDQVHYYPGLNAAALRWLRHQVAWQRAKDTDASKQLVRERIEPSREAARAEAAQGEDLWNTLALCEATLLEDLVFDRFDDARAKELAKEYKSALRNFGKASDHESARRQVEILRELDQRGAKRQSAYQIILDTFTKE